MALRHILGTMLASRMAGRGGRRGGMLGSAAMLGMLGGRRRGGGMGGKLGLAALGYMAYQAYQGQGAQAGQAQAGQGQSGQGQGGQGQGSSGGGLSGLINDIADRLGAGSQNQGQQQQAAPTPSAEEVQAAENYSDEKALLLIRAMIAAAHADGQISPVERSRILQQLQSSGTDSEDRRVVEREIENPRPVDELVAQVRDHDTALEFYLASRAAVDGSSETHRAYLANLRQRLNLSDEEAAEIEGLAS